MSWEPPQVGGRNEVPLTPNESPQRWWRRSYWRVPVWGWAVGAFVLLGAAGGALEPAEDQIDSAQVGVVSGAPVTTSAPLSSERAGGYDGRRCAGNPAAAHHEGRCCRDDPGRDDDSHEHINSSRASAHDDSGCDRGHASADDHNATAAPPPTTTPPPPPPPPPPPVAVQPFLPTGSCDPNYSGCVPIDSDVDCAGGSGNGPSYADGPVSVIGRDVYDLDSDGDGIACDR